MRQAVVTTFHDTVSFCFNSVLEMTGTSVRDLIYEGLERRGIPASDISARFDDVVAILNESFGGSVRVIVYKTVVELCQQIPLLLPQVTRFTGATNGDCGKLTDSELTANGMARATGTVTYGLTGSNSSPQTTTVVHILTDATASQAVARSCLANSSTQGSVNNVQLIAATFTAITLLLGDTTQITWSILWTWP